MDLHSSNLSYSRVNHICSNCCLVTPILLQPCGPSQAPLSMGFPRQEYWSRLPFPSPGNLPNPGTEPRSPALRADSLWLSHQYIGKLLYTLITGCLQLTPFWLANTHVICCCCSVAKSCPTLCGPKDCSTPGFPVPHHLPEFTQVHVLWIGDTIQLSHPLSPSSPSAFTRSQHQSLF